MAEIITLGSLYFDGQPRKPERVWVRYRGEHLQIGDTVPGYEIQWVKLKTGMLVADRCVCVSVSWEQLNALGLIFGTVIQVDGKWYLCRCLKVGAQKGDPNEWDAALDEVGEDDEIWNWDAKHFIGQETDLAGVCATRGFEEPRVWRFPSKSYRCVSLGYRPVLEPLIPTPEDFAPFAGGDVAPMGPDKLFISGRLVSYTDYDLVLEPDILPPADCKWAARKGNLAIVDRSSIEWLRKS